MKQKDKIALEILKSNHLEHFKIAKDLSMLLDIDDPKRKRIEDETNNLVKLINNFKNSI